MVQRAKERREVIEQRGSRPPIDNYVDGLFEATEIHEIMRAFQGNTSAALILLQQRRADWPIAPAALVQVVLVGHCHVIERGGGHGGVVVGAEGQSDVHTQRMSNLVPDLVLDAKYSIAGIRLHGCNGQTSRASELGYLVRDWVLYACRSEQSD